MDLLSAIKKADKKAITTAVKAGDRVGYGELMAALKKPDAILTFLVELGAIDLGKRSENPLHWIGYEIRSTYPNALRNKRAGDPSIAEPKPILELKRKADVLVAAGAKVDFEAALRLGRYADAERMLRKDPKLAKKRVTDDPPGNIAAWSGAWDVAALVKAVAKSGKAFDAAKAEKDVVAWANKAVVALAKKAKGTTFRRLAFDFDLQGTLLLAADSGKAKMPGDYTHSQFADLTSAPRGGDLLDSICAQPLDRALAILTAAAAKIDASVLTQTKDFAVLVFDHDEDEAAAKKRSAKKKTAK